MKQMMEERPVSSTLSPEGYEIPDPIPMAPPIGFKRQPSLSEQIREMVRSERLAQEAAQAGYETFEEADDFEVGDDYDPSAPYETEFDLPPVSELRRRQREAEPPQPAPPQEQKKKVSGDQPDPVIGGTVSPDPKPAA